MPNNLLFIKLEFFNRRRKKSKNPDIHDIKSQKKKCRKYLPHATRMKKKHENHKKAKSSLIECRATETPYIC